MTATDYGDRATYRAIGLMSGTSLDGIDIALIETDGVLDVTRGPSRTYGFSTELRGQLEEALEMGKGLAARTERPGDLRAIEAKLTDRHAEIARHFASEIGLALCDVDIVGFHGQTVLHKPNEALTVQLGDGDRLASALGVPVAWDLRARDMESAGQGAPLVPAYHRALAANLPPEFAIRPVAFVNIGGISNITYIDGDEDPIAFDCGPGNALIDQWLQREAGIPFDQNGRIASEGTIIETLADRYLNADFFAKKTPKSLDRFDFPVPDPDDGELSDVARTLCYVTARGIAQAREHLPERPELWIVAGGGRRHPTILSDLADALGDEADVVLAEDCGFDGDAMEAEAWAYLAVRSIRGLPLTFPTTTGCREPVSGGRISKPGTKRD
ncbi:anhydro-N-acetylmuramic acid kinase [Fulvimarina sp. 2208YS6-2-32]|uniref:Anhydro-N-acetylmuramic acid kinase n=1 Tax=Fulvimarina uroteuthidis TaxID=3098149 RepID=A0ABU5I5H4_9HYPH|nr:anhydro-N-acetylmuramic acid kinase [Fulvimarina sp. 2208YS6-2-32]MDY8110629.1 anhydro-N-acetylmuramic acid kinase [Fulvimarina sp. 2208YS6-2-32]